MGQPFLDLAATLCPSCGRCCKSQPGGAAPEDFGSSREEIIMNVRFALTEGNWRIDNWDGVAIMPVSDKDVMEPCWLRPATKTTEKGRIFSGIYGGECVFLDSTSGCRLTVDDKKIRRPFECRHLEPAPHCECKVHYKNKLTVAEMWIDAGIDVRALGHALIEDIPDLKGGW